MNIVIAAVGGQGALLASRVIGNLAQITNQDVKVSEIHGMSQRGGSVITCVKFADKVYSPIIEEGTADVVLGLELLEGARYVSHLKEDGELIINTQQIDPMPVIMGQEDYPQDLLTKLNKLDINLTSANALEMAKEAGSKKTVNVIMIGMLAAKLDIPKEKWLQAVKETVPEKLVDVNLKAFELGYSAKFRKEL